MKREKCLGLLQKRFDELARTHNIVKELPLKALVLLSFSCPIKRNGWRREPVNIICEPITFNTLSVKAGLVAVENEGAYPFDYDHERRSQNRPVRISFAFAFSKIITWEHYDSKNLPLLLGWPNRYTRLTELLRDQPAT